MITTANSSTSNLRPFINGYDFRSLSISHQSKPIAISRRKAKLIEKQKVSPHFEVEFSDFDYKFSFEIIKIEGELPSNEIVLHLRFNDNYIRAILSGNWQDNEGLYVNNFGLGIENQGDTPISAFLLKTLWAMLALSAKVKIQIQILNQEAITSFDANLNEISELLQIRQIAYRLMVLEKATQTRFPFPQFIDGKYVENIAYCYHSVVDRKFEWLCAPVTIPWVSSQLYLSLLPEKNVPFPIQFGPEPFEKEIFGYLIDLGLQTAKIEEFVLDNFDEVKKKLSKLDGNEVLVQARSKSGVMQIESITTPILPKNAFSQDIQKLIDLDEKFTSIFMDKYFDLAGATLDGLTEEQIEVITQRPTLDEEAFDF